MEQIKAIKEKATWENVGPSVRFGLACGAVGGIASSFYGLYRSYPHLKLYTYLNFQQYFAYGASIHALRGYCLQHPPFAVTNPPTKSDQLKASSLAGASSGFLINAIFRQRYMLSGTVQFALWGYLGQRAWIAIDEWHTVEVEREEERAPMVKEAKTEEKAFGEGIAAKVAEMMGMRRLDDEEYLEVLGEKGLEIEAKIALIDEEIEKISKENEEEQGS